jgi:protein SCO1
VSENPPDPQPRRIDPIVAWGVIAALAIVGALLLMASNAKRSVEEGGADAAPVQLPEGLYLSDAPRIRLDDADGRPFDTRSLSGNPYLVTFLYTRCRDVCPLIGQDIRDTLQMIGERGGGKVNAVAVSVDPKGDTPDRVARWTADQDLPANFHYLVGEKRELRPVWEEWFTVPSGDRPVDPKTHASSVWVVDASGRLRSRLTGSNGLDSEALASELVALQHVPDL